MTIHLSVAKGLDVTVDGYVRAVERLKDAITRNDSDGVYISVTEAVNWLTSLRIPAALQGDADVVALTFARDRSHHQWASIVYRDEHTGEWLWRSAAGLPASLDPKHQSLKKKPCYEKWLERKTVLEDFGRLETTIAPRAAKP